MADRSLRFDLVARDDASPVIDRLGKHLDGVSKSIDGVGARSPGAFGALSRALGSTGLAAGPVGSLIGGIGSSIDLVSRRLDELGKRGGTLQKLGAVGAGFGAGLAGAGMALDSLATPLEQSRKQLDTAITDTGRSADQFTKPIDQADKRLQGFAIRSADTNQALATLTEGLHDPAKALQYIGETADIAKARHISLQEAADKVVKIYAGSTRALKEFGINVKVNAGGQKELTAATKAHTAAVTVQEKARQRLADLEAIDGAKKKLTISDEITLRDARQKVADANEKVATSTQALTLAQQAAKAPAQDFASMMGEIGQRTQGQAQASVDTFGGHLDVLKTKLLDHVAVIGQKYGPALTGLGAGLTVAGGIVDATGGIVGRLTGGAGRAATTIAQAGTTAETALAGGATRAATVIGAGGATAEAEMAAGGATAETEMAAGGAAAEAEMAAGGLKLTSMLGALAKAGGLAAGGIIAGNLIQGHSKSNSLRTEGGDIARGAGIGAAAGSVVPVVGTALGGAAGALGGAIYGVVNEGSSAQAAYAKALQNENTPAMVAYLESIASGKVKSRVDTAAQARADLHTLGVPGYARGGIITRPTLAELGEGGRPEAVIPLTDPRRAAELLRQAGIGGGTHVTVNAETNADATDIAREVGWALRIA